MKSGTIHFASPDSEIFLDALSSKSLTTTYTGVLYQIEYDSLSICSNKEGQVTV